MSILFCYSLLLFPSPSYLLTGPYSAVFEPRDSNTTLSCAKYYLELPINVNKNSDPIRLRLAQELLHEYINALEDRSGRHDVGRAFDVYFDGDTVSIRGYVHVFELTAGIEAYKNQLKDRVAANVTHLFTTQKN